MDIKNSDKYGWFGIVCDALELDAEEEAKKWIQSKIDIKGLRTCDESILLKDVQFSNRTLHALLARHLRTLGDLAKMSLYEVVNIHGIGRASLNEIERKLEAYGLSLIYDKRFN